MRVSSFQANQPRTFAKQRLVFGIEGEGGEEIRQAIVRCGQLGHMGPVTHPEVVNEVIADFLERHG